MLHDVDIDTVYLVQFERVNATPVGTLIHQSRIPTVGRIFRQNDKLGVGSNDRFVCDLWVATVTRIVMEDVDPFRVLQEFVAKGTSAKDKRFSRCAIVYFEQHFWRSRPCHGCLDLVDLLLQLGHERYRSILGECQASYQQDLLEDP